MPSVRGLAAVFLACLLALTASAEAVAQNARVRGFVTDASDGESLQGVNVVLRDLAGALVGGAATDANGYYDLAQIRPGPYVLVASFIGYAPYTDTLALEPGAILTRNIALGAAGGELDEVVVESERTGGAAAVTAGLQTIRVGDIERIPTPDVSGDLAGYLQSLPGVVAAGDRGGQLFIRGGTATQNMALIDGIQLYQPFHIVGFYSAFPSEIIDQVDLYAGGFGARYGGRLSSVIDVSTRDGNKQRYQASLSAAPFLTAGRVEGPLWKGRVSFLASARESFIEQVGPGLLGQELPYRFGDRFAKVHALVGAAGRLSVTAVQTHDGGVLDALQLQDGAAGGADAGLAREVRWKNEAYGARYLLLPAKAPVLAEVLVSYSSLENTFGDPNRPQRASRLSEFNAQMNISHYLRRADIQAGVFVRGSELFYDLRGWFQGYDSRTEFLTEAGGYGEAALKVVPGVVVTPGLRLHLFPSVGRASLEPRLKATWRPGGEEGRQQVSAAWGLYRQELVGLQDRRDAGDVFTAWTVSPVGQGVPQAYHYILGYGAQPVRWLDLSVEGYHQRLSHLVVPEWSAFPAFATDLQEAAGDVTGADLRMEVRGGRFYGFVSYGYARVNYRAQQASLRLWYGTEAYAYHPPHERRHQVSVVASGSVVGVDLSLRWQLGSGLPFSKAVGFDRWVGMEDSEVDVREEGGNARVIYGPPYTGRLPVYHRLDVSVERRFEPLPRVGVTVQGALINAYDRTNLFYLDLFTLRRIDQLPLIPSFGLKIDVD